jgi:drug/metabolite transporter (DMT)-like permease
MRLRLVPVLGIVCGASAIAASAVLIRLSGASPTASALFRCLFAVPVLAVAVLVDRRRRQRAAMPARSRWLARLAGAVLAVVLVLTAYTIDAVGAGLATVLDNLQVVIVGVLAWRLLGEKVGAGLMVAMPVMLVGVGLVAGIVGSGAYGRNPVLGVVYGLGASALYAVFLLLLRKTSSSPTGPVRPLFEVTVGACVGSLLLAVVLPGFSLGPVWPVSLGWLAVLAVNSQVVGWLLITAWMPSVPAALTSALLLIQPAGAVLLAALVFAENPSGWQLAGVLLILLGVVAAAVFQPAKPDCAPVEADVSVAH